MSLQKFREQLESTPETFHKEESTEPAIFKKGDKYYTSVKYDIELSKEQIEGRFVISFGK